ncbi:TlpA family protein disulfide reductase [Agromyces albus]|uniref:TlpA family protein disulfide reductase n=1 Tax=Agromyces albus TaxID=205332 RepID=UPI00278B1325|nr:thioredoxin family protein [Agromyces albus]MDQ0574973.1 thiol-disulfide isomerase/thioredoxin [Agromyces albus]
MDWLAALITGLALPAAATALGFAWKARTGRLHAVRAAGAAGAPSAHDETVESLELGRAALGSAATLVQFSTEYCSRCPSTARQLTGLAAEYRGVRHVEVDLTHRGDLAERFNVLQTPTTLILDADGVPTARIGGVPRLDAVRDHLDSLTGRTRVTS